MRSIAVVDLFCGIGGMTHGFIKEGFHVVAGVDNDSTCQFAYEKNNAGAKFYNWDLTQTSAKEVDALFPKTHTKVFVGCAPCQPFSKITQKYSKEGYHSDKWQLVRVFGELIAAIQPEIVSMENVPELEGHAVFKDYVRELQDLGYRVWHDIVAAEEYGVPQARHRLVLLASRFGEIALIPKTHRKWKTVRQKIGKLQPIEAGEISQTDRLHHASHLSPLNLKRIKNTRVGGTWRDWPEELLLECHKRATGKSYSTAYARMPWDEPSPTITTEFINLGSGKFGHPEQNRALSLREGALLQTFPRTYKLIPPRQNVSKKHLARHIGNAVPVRLGRMVARSIKRHLEEHGISTQ